MTGYVISPGYPQTYSADGRRLWVTIAARAGSGVLLQTVDMELRPEVAGLCTDYVEVNCSANSTSWRHCGTTPWSISPDRCRGDVNVTFVTTQHTKLYKGFVVFFRREYRRLVLVTFVNITSLPLRDTANFNLEMTTGTPSNSIAALLLAYVLDLRFSFLSSRFFHFHFHYQQSPTHILCCCSPFSSHSFRISLNAVLPSHSASSPPVSFPISGHLIYLPIFHLPF